MHVTRRSRAFAAIVVLGLAVTACSSGGGASGGTGGNGSATDEVVDIAVNHGSATRPMPAVIGKLLEDQLGYKVEYKDADRAGQLGRVRDRRSRRHRRELGPHRPGEDVHHRQGGRGRRGQHRRRRHHRLVRPAVDGREVSGHHRLEQPQQVRRAVQDVRVRRQGPAARRRPVVRDQRRGASSTASTSTTRSSTPAARRPSSRRSARPSRTRRRSSATSTRRSGSSTRSRSYKINFPPWTEGCDYADPWPKITCDYAPYTGLNKIISKNLEDKAPSAAQFIKNFKWTAEDQNTVSNYIANEAMSRRTRPPKWIADNEATWKAWMPAS